MAKKTSKKKEIKLGAYVAKVNVAGRVFESTGQNAREAIENLRVPNAKGRGILSVSNGTAKKERILSPYFVFRLFNSTGLTRQVALKNTTLLFDGI